jgi:TRAP-type C4-dicarboxylate transport system permease small subunit
MAFIDRMAKISAALGRWLRWVAGAGLMAMLCLTVADVIGIKVFKSPVPGAVELVGFMGVVVVAFALTYTEVKHGNIQVEFFVTRMPRRWRAGAAAFVYLLSLVLFALLAWQSYGYARVLQTTGEVSMTQNIPFYPFVYALGFCCIPLCFVLFVEFLRQAVEVARK